MKGSYNAKVETTSGLTVDASEQAPSSSDLTDLAGRLALQQTCVCLRCLHVEETCFVHTYARGLSVTI